MTGTGVLVCRGGLDVSPLREMLKEGDRPFCAGLHLDLDEFFRFDETGRYGTSVSDLPEGWEDVFTRHESSIAKSIESQLEILRSKELPASYLDGHHNTHLLLPVLNLVLPLMRRYGIARMRFAPGFYGSAEDVGRAREMMGYYGVISSDSFADLGDIMAGRFNPAPGDAGALEVMAHPDLADEYPDRLLQFRYLEGGALSGYELISWTDHHP